MLSAVFISMSMSRTTQWRFQGVAYPNTTLKWVPDHVPPSGLTFIHLSGNGTVRMGNHLIDVRGHEFVHTMGLPELAYNGTINLVAEAHLISYV